MAPEKYTWTGLTAQDIVNTAAKQKHELENEEDESEFGIAMRKSLNISQNKWPLQTISQSKHQLCKKK